MFPPDLPSSDPIERPAGTFGITDSSPFASTVALCRMSTVLTPRALRVLTGSTPQAPEAAMINVLRPNPLLAAAIVGPGGPSDSERAHGSTGYAVAVRRDYY
ncbi:hypothetical protein GCM10022140_47030 [Rhodococcus aetherivorans]